MQGEEQAREASNRTDESCQGRQSSPPIWSLRVEDLADQQPVQCAAEEKQTVGPDLLAVVDGEAARRHEPDGRQPACRLQEAAGDKYEGDQGQGTEERREDLERPLGGAECPSPEIQQDEVQRLIALAGLGRAELVEDLLDLCSFAEVQRYSFVVPETLSGEIEEAQPAAEGDEHHQ